MSKEKTSFFSPFFATIKDMLNNQNSYKVGIVLWVALLLFAIPISKMAVFALSSLSADNPKKVIIQIHKGQTPNDLTRLLASSGVIADQKTFLWLGRLTRKWKSIKAGEYEVSPAMTPLEIFSVITSGISIFHPVTVREGENMFEIADDLLAKGLGNREEFLSLCRSQQFIKSLGYFKDHLPPSLEGYLFPDTYFFNRTLTSVEIIKQMVKHFFNSWGIAEEKRAKALNMTLHQTVTLASMIEKETGAAEERPIISSVFHNRLRKGMKLQSDPTTIYGIWERYDGKLRKKDLTTQNDFNTYSIPGLPIGPIANPGKESLHAALYPESSPYLYFVSHNDGTHEFSKTIEEHNRAVRKFQLDPKARLGKSWRDHLKKPASVGTQQNETNHQ